MSTLKVLIWNMQRRETNWAYLANEADFDIALLQEATYPTGYEDKFQTIIHHPKKKRGWGSAIVSRTIKLLAHNNLKYGFWGFQLNGSLVVAHTEDENPLWFASIHAWHGLLTPRDLVKNPIQDMVIKDKNNTQEITVIQHLLTQHLQNKSFIVGGDLNANHSRDKEVFDKFSQKDFFEARTKFYDLPQQTYFKISGAASAIDHVFVDKNTFEKLCTFQVQVEISRDAQLSDHAPILTEYKI